MDGNYIDIDNAIKRCPDLEREIALRVKGRKSIRVPSTFEVHIDEGGSEYIIFKDEKFYLKKHKEANEKDA